MVLFIFFFYSPFIAHTTVGLVASGVSDFNEHDLWLDCDVLFVGLFFLFLRPTRRGSWSDVGLSDRISIGHMIRHYGDG